ncbi:MAG: hypothetical protein VCA36_10690 [Opitutales bacterium]
MIAKNYRSFYHRLVDKGHPLVVIEHNVDILVDADYLVELGLHGGSDGGRLLFEGSPTELARGGGTPRASFLSRILPDPKPKEQ